MVEMIDGGRAWGHTQLVHSFAHEVIFTSVEMHVIYTGVEMP